jgi:hypothetical protein
MAMGVRDCDTVAVFGYVFMARDILDEEGMDRYWDGWMDGWMDE